MKKELRKFQAMYLVYYLGLVIPLGYVLPYLKSLGMSDTEATSMISIMTTFGIAGKFITGYLCDYKKTIKRIAIAYLIISTFSILIFYNSNNTLVLIMTITALGLFLTPLSALLDSWTLEINPMIKENFGAVRALGSLGWAISAFIIGHVIDKFGWGIPPYLYLILSLALFLIIKDMNDAKKVSSNKGAVNFNNVVKLLLNKKYATLVIAFMFVSMAMTTFNIFAVLKIQSLGGTQKDNGLFFFISAISEVPIFFLAKYLLKKFTATPLLIFSIIMFGVRTILLAFSTSVIQVILIGASQMVTFAIFMFSSKVLIDEVCEENLRTTSQMISLAISSGIGGVISTALSGFLSDRIGLNNAILFQVVLISISLIISIKYYYDNYKKPNKIEIDLKA